MQTCPTFNNAKFDEELIKINNLKRFVLIIFIIKINLKYILILGFGVFSVFSGPTLIHLELSCETL